MKVKAQIGYWINGKWSLTEKPIGRMFKPNHYDMGTIQLPNGNSRKCCTINGETYVKIRHKNMPKSSIVFNGTNLEDVFKYAVLLADNWFYINVNLLDVAA
ncbi:hypothetical protein [Fictibacillus terranigra]|uniref:Uncharacterized protein n=1 Tax=Fictibacillus terranigra TaxID=3058424 RepID=A0ABT8E8S8_9BACL|nr:hypothetical protein [Fictibacillus sp. CENA-BCM004]MDN4074322.1 hypothetical protein [Fictibacillus sp. CENA-BCM004]